MVCRSRTWQVASLLVALAVGPFGPALAGEGRDGQTGGPAPAPPPVIDVQRDSEKTVYTIGSSPKAKGKTDKDRSWDMLNNVLIDARGVNGKRPDNNR